MSKFLHRKKKYYENIEYVYIHVYIHLEIENREKRCIMVIPWTSKKKSWEREKWKKETKRFSVRCGHGPSGRMIFYRIYLSRILSSMKKPLAWKFLVLLINSWQDKPWPWSKRIGTDLKFVFLFHPATRKVKKSIINWLFEITTEIARFAIISYNFNILDYLQYIYIYNIYTILILYSYIYRICKNFNACKINFNICI